jgi:hypothetical protein
LGEFAGYERTEHPNTGKSWKMVNFPLKEGVRTSDDGIFGKRLRVSLKMQRHKKWRWKLFPQKRVERGWGREQNHEKYYSSFSFQFDMC